ncbi:hypothetical protein AMTRI_Chr11g94300 [Amborella trichopoda]
MAACRSLQYYFDNPKAKTSLLNDLDALASWGRMNPARAQVELAAITELFGELHFQEKPKFQVANEEEESADLSQDQENGNSQEKPRKTCSAFDSLFHIPDRERENFLSFLDAKPDKSSSSSLNSFLGLDKKSGKNSSSLNSLLGNSYCCASKDLECFSPKSSPSSRYCTEGLGFESCEEIEEAMNPSTSSSSSSKHEKEEEKTHDDDGGKHECSNHEKALISKQVKPWPKVMSCERGSSVRKRERVGNFPPPISCIGRNGQPWVSLRSYRHDGRFVLREIRVPIAHEFLRACREDGRLKLRFIQSEEEEEKEEDGDEN